MSYEEVDTCLRVIVGRKRGSVGNSSVTNHERANEWSGHAASRLDVWPLLLTG